MKAKERKKSKALVLHIISSIEGGGAEKLVLSLSKILGRDFETQVLCFNAHHASKNSSNIFLLESNNFLFKHFYFLVLL